MDEVDKTLQVRGKHNENTSIKGSIHFSQLIVGWHPLERPEHQTHFVIQPESLRC